MSKSGTVWTDEDRIEELRMFLNEVSCSAIAAKYERTVSAIEKDRDAFKAFLRGTLSKSYIDSNFFKHCRLLLFEILIHTL